MAAARAEFRFGNGTFSVFKKRQGLGMASKDKEMLIAAALGVVLLAVVFLAYWLGAPTPEPPPALP